MFIAFLSVSERVYDTLIDSLKGFAIRCTFINPFFVFYSRVIFYSVEIKMQGYKILVLADVATNLITDLVLGNDWITENNVVFNSPQRHIFLLDNYYCILARALFIEPPDLQLPILLTDEITLPRYSKNLLT